MAKKLKLNVDLGQDKSLLAILCHKKDYWLAFQINQLFQMKFRRIRDFLSFHSESEKGILYPIFYFRDNEQGLEFYLISNGNPEGKLIPNFSTTDFFLLISGKITGDQMGDFLSRLRKIPGLLMAHEVARHSLKDFENLMTDLELHMIENGD